MDTTKAITHVSLCAGYGGIDLGLSRAIPSLRTVAFSEIEAFACANLVSKMEAGLLDCAPIWTNLKTFPWAEFYGRVDLLSGGYPCQPFSSAGKRLGTEDPRHLWPFIANGIRLMRPKLCFFENVEGHISLGLREVISKLESMGYKVSWGIFSAREVGAPHQRKRVFIMAHDKSQRIQGHWAAWLQESRPHAGQAIPLCSGEGCELADTNNSGSGQDRLLSELRTTGIEQSSRCSRISSQSTQAREIAGWPSRPGEPQHGWEPPRVVGDTIPNPTDNGLEIDTKRTIEPSEGDRRVSYIGGVCTCEGASMGDTKHNGSHQCGADTGGAESSSKQGRLQKFEGGSASVGDTESKQGTPRDHRGQQGSSSQQEQVKSGGADCGTLRESNGQAESPLGRDSNGIASGMDYAELQVSCDNRTDELRLLGNGVVPATAERAFRTLLAELIP